MPRADGPFKIIEKINDNAYKLELPPEFGVSPTFNIAYLKPYLGEEDELESRTTPLQEREDDEDISSMHVIDTPPIMMHGTYERNKKALGTNKGEERSKEGVQVKLEAQFILESATSASRDSLRQNHRPSHKRAPFSAIHICLER
ncbi:hypothetical protein U9M48_003433 [Paspalum notatum var. saurae]|uniref:Tf2-1-like SH3-like domain-containing protein n=1 Tax=Paspalum notatum var. saurae TaxID=547442 RepID=A0AAQ3PIH9_PASNO